MLHQLRGLADLERRAGGGDRDVEEVMTIGVLVVDLAGSHRARLPFDLYVHRLHLFFQLKELQLGQVGGRLAVGRAAIRGQELARAVGRLPDQQPHGT